MNTVGCLALLDPEEEGTAVLQTLFDCLLGGTV